MIIADTGFWLALANRHDKYHALARSRLGEINESFEVMMQVLLRCSTCPGITHPVSLN